ncbi:hypothetical protein AC579_6430 [Pseudocercospora musae]|uniref:Uncharacterized protein n=1 Tax=Pseudocercospora musae TaxID=113226 RepID=A0A139I226_9PEZI|nr:hypothetical protein AC579_6430 [Pseudocercospora musae]
MRFTPGMKALLAACLITAAQAGTQLLMAADKDGGKCTSDADCAQGCKDAKAKEFQGDVTGTCTKGKCKCSIVGSKDSCMSICQDYYARHFPGSTVSNACSDGAGGCYCTVTCAPKDKKNKCLGSNPVGNEKPKC